MSNVCHNPDLKGDRHGKRQQKGVCCTTSETTDRTTTIETTDASTTTGTTEAA